MTERLGELLRLAAPSDEPVAFASVERALRARRRRRTAAGALLATVVVVAVAVPLVASRDDAQRVLPATSPAAPTPAAAGVSLGGVTVPAPAGWHVSPAVRCEGGQPYTVGIEDESLQCARAGDATPSIALVRGAALGVSGTGIYLGPCSFTRTTVAGYAAVLQSCGLTHWAPTRLQFEAFGTQLLFRGLDQAQVDDVLRSVRLTPAPLAEPADVASLSVHRSTTYAVSSAFDVTVRDPASVARIVRDIRDAPAVAGDPSGCPTSDPLSITAGERVYDLAVGTGCGVLTDGGGSLHAVSPDLVAALRAVFPDHRL